eukprot:6541859-Prymnesium_polylepis.1
MGGSCASSSGVSIGSVSPESTLRERPCAAGGTGESDVEPAHAKPPRHPSPPCAKPPGAAAACGAGA